MWVSEIGEYCESFSITLNIQKMINNMIVVTVTEFSGTTTPDKNGESPIMLQCIAGEMPNRNVLSGTVGRRAGFEVGKTYLVNVRENGFDDLFGSDFTFIKVKELETGLDVARTAKEIGNAQIIRIDRPEGFENNYKRKGDAVESNRTVRMKQGFYHPSVFTSLSQHATATAIKPGTSVGSGGQILHEPTEPPHIGEDDLPL